MLNLIVFSVYNKIFLIRSLDFVYSKRNTCNISNDCYEMDNYKLGLSLVHIYIHSEALRLFYL